MLIETSPFEWFSQHLHLAGWGTVIAIVWKASRFLTRAESRLKNAETKGEVVYSMTTNHIPTSLNEISTKTDKSIEILQSIDSNIAILVDRGTRV